MNMSACTSANVYFHVCVCICTLISAHNNSPNRRMGSAVDEKKKREIEQPTCKKFYCLQRCSPHFPSIKCYECHRIHKPFRKICVRIWVAFCDLYLCQMHIFTSHPPFPSHFPLSSTRFCFMILHFHNFFCIGHVHNAQCTHTHTRTHAHVIHLCLSHTDENNKRQRCCCYYFMNVWW